MDIAALLSAQGRSSSVFGLISLFYPIFPLLSCCLDKISQQKHNAASTIYLDYFLKAHSDAQE